MNHRKTNEGLEERLPGLIAAARTGDQQAFTALYEATKQEVYRTARAVLQSEQAALDIQQAIKTRTTESSELTALPSTARRAPPPIATPDRTASSLPLSATKSWLLRRQDQALVLRRRDLGLRKGSGEGRERQVPGQDALHPRLRRDLSVPVHDRQRAGTVKMQNAECKMKN